MKPLYKIPLDDSHELIATLLVERAIGKVHLFNITCQLILEGIWQGSCDLVLALGHDADLVQDN